MGSMHRNLYKSSSGVFTRGGIQLRPALGLWTAFCTLRSKSKLATQRRVCYAHMPWNCTKLPTVTGKAPPECTLEADGCMCSRGCQSTYACSPSALCSRPEARPSGAALKVPIVLFLQFNESLVRHKYAAHPATAYRREFNRILWFVESARRVQTRMPLYVAVGGRRNHSAEAHLQRLGVGIVSLPFVAPPSWSSLFHHFSFSRIAALSLTQFEKVSS